MTDEHPPAIPIGAYPDPVAAYTVRDEEVLVTATNEPFEAVFDRPMTGSPIAEIFAQFDVVNSMGEEPPLPQLRRGDAFGVYLEGLAESGPFIGRSIPIDEETGYIAFAPLAVYPGIDETARVGQVASVISHDLRNPLDVAEAHLRAARETGDPEHFDAVASSHDRMEEIIQDVLTLAPGRTVVEPVEGTDIESAVAEAWQSVDTEQATLAIQDGLPTTTADPDRVRRLFENLFRNSVEHTSATPGPDDHPGEVTITVGALGDGFYVSDDGPGIPPADQEEIFTPGYSTKDRGTGLGLAIVEKIVSAHEWDLTLTTAQTGGARFEVRF